MFYRPGLDPHGLPHNPLKALIAPRPIAWVSTLSADGSANLAPFSFFNAVADAPPVVMISVGWAKPDGSGKDTLSNIRATEEFVINLVADSMRDAMNATSAHVSAQTDEFSLAGLTRAASETVAPPRITDAPAALECRLRCAYDIPQDSGSGYTAVFGDVLGIHIHDSALTDGKFDAAQVKLLARMGYRDYSRVESTFTLDRPDAQGIAEGRG